MLAVAVHYSAASHGKVPNFHKCGRRSVSSVSLSFAEALLKQEIDLAVPCCAFGAAKSVSHFNNASTKESGSVSSWMVSGNKFLELLKKRKGSEHSIIKSSPFSSMKHYVLEFNCFEAFEHMLPHVMFKSNTRFSKQR